MLCQRSQPNSIMTENKNCPQDIEVIDYAHLVGNTTDFPFLIDDETVKKMHNFKVMFILRGPSGSGKTTIAKLIQAKYHSHTQLVSANLYFFNQQGEYHFDGTRLSDAHALAQEKGRFYCCTGKPLVIVDNTNIEEWELGPYFNLAARYKYTPVLVNPRTPWLWQAEELAERSKRDMTERSLRRKLQQFQVINPLYYAWFLSEADTKWLYNLGDEIFGLFQLSSSTLKERLDPKYICSGEAACPFHLYYRRRKLVHCTSFYNGADMNTLRATYYNKSPVVQNSLGKIFSLHIVGFVVTKNAFSARVALSRDELQLWGQPDSEHLDANELQLLNANSPWERGRKRWVEPDWSEEIPETSPLDTLVTSPKYAPIRGRGDSAHITLGFAPNTRAAQAGVDLMELVRRENSSTEASTTLKLSEGQIYTDEDQNVGVERSTGLTSGELRVFPSGQGILYLDTPLVLSALFSGSYRSVPPPSGRGPHMDL